MQSAGLFIGGFRALVTMLDPPSCGVNQRMGATRREIHPLSSKAMQPLLRERCLCDHDVGQPPWAMAAAPWGEACSPRGDRWFVTANDICNGMATARCDFVTSWSRRNLTHGSA